MARREEAAAVLQNLSAVATSPGAISATPLTSAGLSGSDGSAAMRSHSTRSADCARAGAGGAQKPASTARPSPKVQPIAAAPFRSLIIMSPLAARHWRRSKLRAARLAGQGAGERLAKCLRTAHLLAAGAELEGLGDGEEG